METSQRILRETRIDLADVAKSFKLRYETVRGWTTKGVRGRVLEAVKLGGRIITSQEALERFAEPVGHQQASEPVRPSLSLQRKKSFAEKFRAK